MKTSWHHNSNRSHCFYCCLIEQDDTNALASITQPFRDDAFVPMYIVLPNSTQVHMNLKLDDVFCFGCNQGFVITNHSTRVQVTNKSISQQYVRCFTTSNDKCTVCNVTEVHEAHYTM